MPDLNEGHTSPPFLLGDHKGRGVVPRFTRVRNRPGVPPICALDPALPLPPMHRRRCHRGIGKCSGLSCSGC